MFDFLAQHDFNPLITSFLVFFTILAGILAIKFDLNRFLEMRRERQKERLRFLRPHVELLPVADGFEVHSQFVSPVGTTAWQYQNCGAETHNEAATTRDLEYWATHPMAYVKRLKKIGKTMRHL